MDEGMIGCRIKALGRFKMKIVNRSKDKHFNADGRSKQTELYQLREERRADEPRTNQASGFSLNKSMISLNPRCGWMQTGGTMA